MPQATTSSSAALSRTAPTMRHRRRRVKLTLVLRYFVLLALAAMFLLPFYLIARNSLMTTSQIASPAWRWLPWPPNWSNFAALFRGPNPQMLSGLRNSAIIAATTMVLQTLLASMGGYALARLRAPGSRAVFYLILATLMIPAAVTFVPTFAVVAFLGGVDTMWGLIVPGLFSAMFTFLFRQYYLDFPREIEEAGRVDGLGYLGIYWRLVLPNSVNLLVAVGAMAFIASWNAFLWPLVIGQDSSMWTVQVVMSSHLSRERLELGRLFAAATVAVAPLVILFLVLQRHIMEGAKFSGVKG